MSPLLGEVKKAPDHRIAVCLKEPAEPKAPVAAETQVEPAAVQVARVEWFQPVECLNSVVP